MEETMSNENLSVQISLFDKQHLYLVDLLESLKNAIIGQEPKANLLQRFALLIANVKQHFKDEEALMAHFEFDGFEPHKKSHDAIIKKVGLQFAEYSYNSPSINLEFFVTELENEIVRHILHVDRKYSDFFLSKGVK